MASVVTHDSMANAIRALSMDSVEKAKSGHPGLPMGAADMATVLFRDVLKFDAADPAWPDRDLFVLSAGHGSMLLYALLHLTGFASTTMYEIKNFRPYARRRDHHRTTRPGPRNRGWHGDGRAEPGRAVRRAAGRPPHLGDRR